MRHKQSGAAKLHVPFVMLAAIWYTVMGRDRAVTY